MRLICVYIYIYIYIYIKAYTVRAGDTLREDNLHKDTLREDTLHKDVLREDLLTFIIISRSILPTIRNVTGNMCRENQKTFSIL
jgi:hypothetical protein